MRTFGQEKREKKQRLSYRALYQAHAQDAAYRTTQKLGVTLEAGETHFALWSPIASHLTLCLYEDGIAGSAFERIPMAQDAEGVFHGIVPRNLKGTYYDYEIVIDGTATQTTDPYGIACGVNGIRNMVVDLASTDPEGWESDRAPEKQAEEIIYELHVKEYTWQEESGVSAAHRGTYAGLTEDSRALSHLQELGVTHVQLMPIYDFGSVNEAGSRDAFNWGYDPVHFNIPEGSYASDPYHGEVRIREVKQMVQALHRAGLRVIMDVVYNHTFSLESDLQKTMPWYYYRIFPTGEISNGSQCGNDIASEREMCARMIVDSVLYWAEEYHIDGFRFDLMGLLDTRLMNRIRAELDGRFGTGEKLIYGEPWAAAKTAMEPGMIPAITVNRSHLSPQIGMFCDALRDDLKGSVFDDAGRGFVNGKPQKSRQIARGLMGYGEAPGRWIVYTTSHDNHTLWDKLSLTTPDEAMRLRQNKLAAAIYMLCPGRPFLLSGEEFGRTKEGLDNTFDAPITINRIDWRLADQNRELITYYQKLIALRKALSVLHTKDRVLTHQAGIVQEKPGVVMMRYEDPDPKARYREILTIYIADAEPMQFCLPEGDWEVLLEAPEETKQAGAGQEEFDHAGAGQVVRGMLSVPGISAVVLGRV
ncbi:MAG: type I pullulanase [Lachnospiraceae bacterium]|nr:type I pullulanase [Lachnospiraceae bacterium]